MTRSLGTWAALAFVCAAVGSSETSAQASANPLERPLALQLSGATIDEALRAVQRAAGVRLSYSSDLLPPAAAVTIGLTHSTVGAALREILRGTELGMAVAGTGHIVILHAPLVRALRPDSGSGAHATAAGAPRIAQQMDRVLVMGTPAAGAPERELTTSVSVVPAAQLRAAPTAGMAQQFRDAIPGVVAWDLGQSGPIAQVGSVRGSSSFSANYLKTYLDGVELASPYLLFAVDPALLDRIEVIRGPQGSAMYGSDAISGVAHLVTRKGTIGEAGAPRLEATLAGGSGETKFADESALAHHFIGAALGAASLASWQVSAAHSDDGTWVAGAHSRSTSALAAGRLIVGHVMLEGSARATDIDFSAPVSPLLTAVLGTRAPPRAAAAAANQVIHARTTGLTAIHEPTQAWRQSLVLGYDRNWGALAPQRNPATVADALLGASGEDARRASLRYSTSLRVDASPEVVSTTTAGVELSHLERERSGTSDVINGDPAAAAPTRPVALYVDTVNNTGAFAQWKLDVRHSLVLVGGLRAERNSNFGAGYGTAWSPMAGATWLQHLSALTVKWRAAYGKGIRPPPPSARRALATREFRQLPNPDLAPESQEGFEAGVELYLSNRLSLSVTGYDQRAEGLIQHVLPNPRTAPRVVQLQNVGRIGNRGVELQAFGQAGPLSAEASLAAVTSRVEALSHFYGGDLRVGDDVPEVPAWSGAASVAWRWRSLRVTAGASYLGPWTGYDWLGYYKAIVAGDPTPALRDHWMRYASTVRPHLGVSQDLGERFGWFTRVENLANEQRDTRDNLQIAAGRTTWLGVRLATR